MKKNCLSILAIASISICSCLIVTENRVVGAKEESLSRKTSQNISPELRIKIDEWMKLLYSDDSAIRTSAVISLLGLNISTVYDSLIDILKNSENDDVRISLIKAFGFAGDDSRALDCMIDLIISEKEELRIASADALGNIRTKKAIEEMAGILLDKKKPIESRILVTGALAKTRSREAVEPLINVLESDNNDLQIAAHEALMQITKQSNGKVKSFWQEWWNRNRVKTREQWLEDIVDKLEEGSEKLKAENKRLRDEIVEKTIKILKTNKESDNIRPLIDALKSEYQAVRIYAAGELANHHNDPEVIKIFVNLISDNDTEIRVLAVNVLGKIGGVPELKNLILALQDKEIRVRESAARSLGRLGEKEAVFDLLSALSDTANSVVCAAAEALGELKAGEAVEPLIKLFSNKDPKVRESAIVALGKFQDNRAIEPLINSLKDKEERVRWYAADTLGKIGKKKAVLPLIALLSDESARVRESTAAALGLIGHESAVEPLIKLLEDVDNRVAEKAADMLLLIKCESLVLLDSIVNAFYAVEDYKRSKEILKKQINQYEGLPEYDHELWQSKKRLAKLYFSSNDCQKATLLYEELVTNFDDNIEIKHELVHCLKEAKQFDKLLSFLSLWIESLSVDNHMWWPEIYGIIEGLFNEGYFERVRTLIDDFEKKNPHLGGPELKSGFYDLRKQSMAEMSPQDEGA
ncbi:peptidase C14, caspase catalytic subunit p20 [Candidatus Scalindua japonica]|uniref:Peptidase C14, caspase catalytic subunit p20 n=1 Tax=Candidatus Scalindua japonica TaxID=1284222 RepID=A0A286TZP3_9BACT|nr:HEAT repeat domain-containing protein [Candidatus Scalindua japonica]GAX61281.1 peptidase C14, caspase catalytic subunit p20 [Candidatus Scalindua japonica]